MDNHLGALAVALNIATLLALAYISLFNSHLGKAVMSTQSAVDAVVTQLRKVSVEINAKIADLRLQIQDAQVSEVVDISELEAVAQALDDIVPDVVDVVEDVAVDVADGEGDDEA